MHPVHGRHADVLRAGELRVRALPARIFTPRAAVLLRPNRRLHHRLLLPSGGVLQVRLVTLILFQSCTNANYDKKNLKKERQEGGVEVG